MSPGSIPGVLPIYNLSWATWASPWYTYTGVFFRSSGSPVTSQRISIIISSLIAGVPQTSLLWRTLGNKYVGKLVYTTGFMWMSEWWTAKYPPLVTKKNNLFVKVKTALSRKDSLSCRKCLYLWRWACFNCFSISNISLP